MFKRHLMLIAIIVCILFLLGVSIGMEARQEPEFWQCTTKKVDTMQDFYGLCMDVWSKIDLVQAINTTPDERKDILNRLGKSIKVLFDSFDDIKQYRSGMILALHPDEVKILIMTIKEAYQKAFKENDSTSYKKSLVHLEKLLHKLVTPIDN